MTECALCDAMKNEDTVFFESELAAAFVLTHPVTEFHCLVLPKRHVTKLSELHADELKEMFDIMARMSSFIEEKYPGSAVIAINRKGNSTQPHLHFHVFNSAIGGIRAMLAPALGKEFYPPYTKEELQRRAKEYREFIDTELTD